jgi:hypothetical protein
MLALHLFYMRRVRPRIVMGLKVALPVVMAALI